MDSIKRLFSSLPFVKKEEQTEYFFALNIGQESLDAALWELSGKHLQILQTASDKYTNLDEITRITDTLLDRVLGNLDVEPQKILFGVLDSWLAEDDLKEEYLKLLRNVVKELELTPMAYVATSHALLHFLEKKEGVPTTAILVGFEKEHITVTVSRAGKLDGSKVIKRSDNPGPDIEKALLTFTNVETLPSKILIYGKEEEKLDKLKSELLAFSWMSKLSFLHFPKIDILEDALEVKSICLAGAKEINPETVFKSSSFESAASSNEMPQSQESAPKRLQEEEKEEEEAGLGFVVGDIAQKQDEEVKEEMMPIEEQSNVTPVEEEAEERELAVPETAVAATEEVAPPAEAEDFVPEQKGKPKWLTPLVLLFKPFRKIAKGINFRSMPILVALIIIIALGAAYLFLPKAKVKIYVEPQILEKDTQVTADPSAKSVDENAKIIPGQIVNTQVSGSGKGSATGKKEIGDPAKGTVKVINNSSDAQTLTKGTTISAGGVKFTLDSTVNIASTSATADSKSTGTVNATAATVGADGNVASGTQFSSPNSQLAIVAEGNFSGGTSKQVQVVSDEDQQKLLAQVASDLRKQAQQKLQDTLKDKKVLEEGLSEEIASKKFNKNVGDQATDFSLDLTVKYQGTAFDDKDLRTIVSKLVSTDVPSGFELNLQETETQADVSKLEKDGKLIFLARFKAKLTPRLDISSIKNQIKGKTADQVSNILKSQEHILGSEIIITPNLPGPLKRLPFFGKNIDIEVGFK